MKPIVFYLIASTLSLSLFYTVYLFIFRNDTPFRILRFYLLGAILISLIIPLHSVEITLPEIQRSQQEITANNKQNIPLAIKDTQEKTNAQPQIQDTQESAPGSSTNFVHIFFIVYIGITIILILRILIQLATMIFYFITSKRQRYEEYILITNNKYFHSFSFFNWIFVNEKEVNEEMLPKIIAHEKIHINQFHTMDILLIELLTAVMWFNPMVWFMRNSIQLVHEYLADEGALSTGIDRLRYQALLINQVSEERLICLSSGFNHSLIKKRMIMMTKRKFNQQTKLRILTLIPLTLILFIGIACVNGQNKQEKITSIAPTKMNVLYLGVDNPLVIAVSGVDNSEITVETNNGKISGENGMYMMRPKQVGTADIKVFHKEELVQTSRFRVKTVPDPVAKIAGKKSGTISKTELLDAGKVIAEIGNFDFDLQFEVVSFVMSSTVPNSMTVREEISKSNKFSDQQIDLIKSLIPNQKLMIEDIILVGPDGVERKVSPMVFTLSE